MGWKDDPKIRDLEPYAKKHGYQYLVVVGVGMDGIRADVTTFGRTRRLCQAAEIAGEQIMDMIKQGVWPRFPDQPPPDKTKP